MPTYTALQEVKKVYKWDVQIRPDPVIAYRPMKVDGTDHWPNGFNLTDHGTVYNYLWDVQCAYFSWAEYADTYLTGMWSGAPDFTMSIWINMYSYTNWPTLFFTWDQWGTASAWLWVDTSGVLYVWGWTNDRNTWYTLTPNVWYNIVLTHESWTAKVYVNWSLVYTGSVSFNITSSYCVIGRALGAWGNSVWYFNEARIESIVWDATRVANYYNEQSVYH